MENPHERPDEETRLGLLAQSLDETLAFVHRDVCRWGFHEAAALIACARESVREAVSEMIAKAKQARLGDG